MKNQKHTPGPWNRLITHDGYRIQQPNLCFIADVYGGRGSEVEANARLIAAAPEMLEALQGVSELLYYAVDRKLLSADAKKKYDAVLSAIAKAKGGAE